MLNYFTHIYPVFSMQVGILHLAAFLHTTTIDHTYVYTKSIAQRIHQRRLLIRVDCLPMPKHFSK